MANYTILCQLINNNIKLTDGLKGPNQCHYMLLSSVSISHISYINPTYFPKIVLSVRYCVCLHFVRIQKKLQNVPENV